MKSLPNFITVFRICLAPLLIFFITEPLIAFVIFLVASSTDWLDGYVARKYNCESDFGRLMDPLADKILVTTALVLLCSAEVQEPVPPWIAVVILSREFFVTGIRSAAVAKGVVVPASMIAKWKTVVMMVAISMLILGGDLYSPGILVLLASVFLSVYSGAKYLKDYLQISNPEP